MSAPTLAAAAAAAEEEEEEEDLKSVVDDTFIKTSLLVVSILVEP